jgi:hypothetical protein
MRKPMTAIAGMAKQKVMSHSLASMPEREAKLESLLS